MTLVIIPTLTCNDFFTKYNNIDYKVNKGVKKLGKEKINKHPKKPDKVTIAISYPNTRFKKTNIARPSDENVEIAKEWVDDNSRL